MKKISGDVNSIRIDGEMINIKFLVSKDENVYLDVVLYYDDEISDVLSSSGELQIRIHCPKKIGRNKASELTLYLPKGLIFENVRIDNNMSEIYVACIQTKQLGIDVDMSTITIEDAIVDHLHVSSRMGDFNYSGSINKRAEVKNNKGAIVMNLNNVETEVGYYAKNAMGDLAVGKNRHSGFSGLLEGNKGAPVFLDLRSSMGDIKVIFKK